MFSPTIVTVGVEDVDRSVAFYGAFGWSVAAESDPAMCTFVVTPSIVLGIVPFSLLTADARLGEDLRQAPPFGGFTLAVNGRTVQEVDALLEVAERAGGTIHQRGTIRDWGGWPGYSGYFLDPDGYPWEVAHAPFLGMDDLGRLQLTLAGTR